MNSHNSILQIGINSGEIGKLFSNHSNNFQGGCNQWAYLNDGSSATDIVEFDSARICDLVALFV